MGGYGQTEAPASIAFLPPDVHCVAGQLAPDQRLSSVGRPNPLVRVEIMDAGRRILPQGATGEICVSGDLLGPVNVMYEATKAPAPNALGVRFHSLCVQHTLRRAP